MPAGTPPTGKPWTVPGYDPKADEWNSYGYVPSLSMGAAFLAVFSLLTAVHTLQCFWSRRWFLIVLVLGGLGEVAGWAARLVNHFDLYNDDAFMAQIVCLVITPAFMSAAVYAIAGWVMEAIDPSLSFISPRLYWRIFVAGDVASLVVQSIGGGLAASADDQKTIDLGSNVMLAGIIIQLVITVIYAALFGHFLWRVYARDARPSRNIELLTIGNLVATTAVVVRAVYRVIELTEGWDGPIIQTESLFLLDAIPMVICMLALSVVHPHWTLPLAARTDASGTPLAAAARKSHLPLSSTSSGFPMVQREDV